MTDTPTPVRIASELMCTECPHYMCDHTYVHNWTVQCTICDCRYDANRTAAVVEEARRWSYCNTCGDRFLAQDLQRDMYNDTKMFCKACWSKQAEHSTGYLVNDAPNVHNIHNSETVFVNSRCKYCHHDVMDHRNNVRSAGYHCTECPCTLDLVDDNLGNDPVEHPAHYTSDPSGVECIQITRHRNFNIGNAIKYLWRAGLKNPASVRAQTEDLKKAIWYINDEIERLTKSE